MAQVSNSNIEFYFSTAQISYFWMEFYFSLGELCTSTLQIAPCFSQGTCMHLGPKISGVELVFLSAWKSGYSLHYTIRCNGAKKFIYQHTALLIFAPQVYDNFVCWRTPEELLPHFLREFYMEYTTVFLWHHHRTGFIPPVPIVYLCAKLHQHFIWCNY